MSHKQLLTSVFIFAAILVFTTPAKADWLLDQSGYLIQFDRIVLGDSDDVVETETENEVEDAIEDKVEVENKSSENLRETQKQTFEQARERAKTQQETLREAEKKRLELVKEANSRKPKQKYETTIMAEKDRLKLRQEQASPSGYKMEREVELEKFESLHVENEDGTLTEIKPEINRMEIARNRVKARTDLDIKVGEKNEIKVTLPNGKEKEIVVPEKALANLVERGILTNVEGEDGSYSLTAGKNGEPVYQTEGKVEKRLFGLFKMQVNQKLEVAASDAEDGSSSAGDIVNTEISEENPVRRFFARFAY